MENKNVKKQQCTPFYKYLYLSIIFVLATFSLLGCGMTENGSTIENRSVGWRVNTEAPTGVNQREQTETDAADKTIGSDETR